MLTSVWNGLSSGFWNYTVSEITRNLVKVCYSLKMRRLNRPVTKMEKDYGFNSDKKIQKFLFQKATTIFVKGNKYISFWFVLII